MAGKRVRYSSEYSSFHVEGVGDALLMDRDHVFGPLDVLGTASVASLHGAMLAVYRDYAYGEDDGLGELPRFEVTWTLDSQKDIDRELALQENTSLVLMRTGALLVELSVVAGPKARSDADRWPVGEDILNTWLRPRRGRVVSITARTEETTHPYWIVRFALPFRGMTVADVHQIGSQASALLETYDAQRPTVEALVELLRAGHAASLIGMPEGDTFEVKQALHLVSEPEKLELAKDVSAMANSPAGGVLVVGLRSSSRDGQDVVTALAPFHAATEVRRVRALLNHRIYPPLDGLILTAVPATPSAPARQGLLVIAVPPQPRELLPFLVSGVTVGNRVMGAYIGMFRRAGEDTQAATPAAIHSALSTGLALLRNPPRQRTRR